MIHCRASLDYRTERLLEDRWHLECGIKNGPAYKRGELQRRLAEVARQLAEGGRAQ